MSPDGALSASEVAGTRVCDQFRMRDFNPDGAPAARRGSAVFRAIEDGVERAQVGGDSGVECSHIFEPFDVVEPPAGPIRERLQARPRRAVDRRLHRLD